jgi:hypothetical protein
MPGIKSNNFSKKVEKFKIEQEKQKQRGLNDYNIMTAIRKPHAEVGMHSNFIYSLLDINGLHYQDDLFAKLFVEHALLYKDFGKIKEVQMEEDADDRRIDFTIKSDNYYIGIEIKIYAGDQPNQISDYYNNLTEKAKKDNNQIVEIFYLTLDGKEASQESCNTTRYNKISFEWDILNWLEASKKKVQNITNLSNAIGYYTDVVKQLTNKYESPINKYKDFFLIQENYKLYEEFKNEILKQFDYADEIKKGYVEAKQELYDDFYKQIFSLLLEQNSSLSYFRYIQDSSTQQVQLTFKRYYSINLFFNKEHTKLISLKINVAWAYNNEAKGDPLLRKQLEEYGVKLNDQTLKQFHNSVTLKKDFLLESPTADNLFKEKSQVKKLSGNILNEIQEHIDTIEEKLKPDTKVSHTKITML